MKTLRLIIALAAILAAYLSAYATEFLSLPASRPAQLSYGGYDQRDAFIKALGSATQGDVVKLYSGSNEAFSRIVIQWFRKDPQLVESLAAGFRAEAAKARAAKSSLASTYEAAAAAIERQAKDSSLVVSSRPAVAAALKALEASP